LTRREFIRRGLAFGLTLPSILQVLAACGTEPPVSSTASAPATPTAPAPTAAPPASATPARSAATATAGHVTPTLPPPPTPTPQHTTRFAVIGDCGLAGEPEQAVATLVKSWSPDFILSTGDNNYPDGAAETLDANVGQYYYDFIYPYTGQYGRSVAPNRFFP